MPRDGAALLSEWLPKVSLACAACGLAKRYDRDQMLRRIGDVAMTDLLARLAAANDCPRKNPHAMTIRCPARFTAVPGR